MKHIFFLFVGILALYEIMKALNCKRVYSRTYYQERKVFGMFWIYPLTVPYDIPTENTSFAVFILHLIFHNNTSSPFCLLTCISKL